MNNLRYMKNSALLFPRRRIRPNLITAPIRSEHTESKFDRQPRPILPCFDPANVSIVQAHTGHAQLLKRFMYTHYWPREPTVIALWMELTSPYLATLTDKYCYSGDRYFALESCPQTNVKKLVGVSVSSKLFPWMHKELLEWAHHCKSKADQHRKYFFAHCLQNPNLFRKYKVNFIYNIEVLGTTEAVSGQGVGTRLLQDALDRAEMLRYPLVQIIAVNAYAAKACEKCSMKLEWSMQYNDFVDHQGDRVFSPRPPHCSVKIYSMFNDPAIGMRDKPFKPPPE